MMVKTISSLAEFHLVVRSADFGLGTLCSFCSLANKWHRLTLTVVAIDFLTTWGGSHRTVISPVFGKLSVRHTGIGFYTVDLDEMSDISQEVGMNIHLVRLPFPPTVLSKARRAIGF
ncbi:hypothetical protein BJY52DRAFT_529546 [Lactarius psammicola]|nr:hypothetical protein BJY52DRAFT_529546 [Lactarius psammicola]